MSEVKLVAGRDDLCVVKSGASSFPNGTVSRVMCKNDDRAQNSPLQQATSLDLSLFDTHEKGQSENLDIHLI